MQAFHVTFTGLVEAAVEKYSSTAPHESGRKTKKESGTGILGVSAEFSSKEMLDSQKPHFQNSCCILGKFQDVRAKGDPSSGSSHMGVSHWALVRQRYLETTS